MSGRLEGDWAKLESILSEQLVKIKISKAVRQVGIKGASMIQEGIVSGNPGGKEFAPLHPVTVARKGSSKPLVDAGDLVGSITSVPFKESVWIGVNRKAQGGEDLVNIAAVHEFGCTIAVTPKMRGYLHSVGIHLRQDTTHIVIPERSFLRATMESAEFREMVVETFRDAMEEALLP